MGAFKDLTGSIFGKLTVLYKSNNKENKRVSWFCKCSCGNNKIVAANHLNSGHIKSCGCYAKSLAGELGKTHGMSKTSEWYAYWSANRRCSPNNKEKRKAYYDRGIRFKFKSFEEFYIEVGPKPSKEHSLDRINNDGNYESGNVRWATKSEQIRNQICDNCDLLKARITELERMLGGANA